MKMSFFCSVKKISLKYEITQNKNKIKIIQEDINYFIYYVNLKELKIKINYCKIKLKK